MSQAAIELNDRALLITAGDGSVHAEPGFARHTPGGIITGEEARAMAWLEPQNSFNQHWVHLNQKPLVTRLQWARHHGDIAFGQLRNVWQAGGSPESGLLLVPGSYSDEQLSLLLGMAGALPFRVEAVLDSALAACLDCTGDTLFVDLQLHQAVITLVQRNGDRVYIAEQEVFPALGVQQIHNSVARRISQQLIESTRYDPMHNSAHEQALFDRIPGWLQRLRFEEEVSSSLKSDTSDLTFILRKEAVRSILDDRLVNTRSFLARNEGAQVLLSNGASFLSGITKYFEKARILDEGHGSLLAIEAMEEILDQAEERVLLRELAIEVTQPESTGTPINGKVATHLLHGHSALPLDTPVSITISDEQVTLGTGLDPESGLALVLRNGQLEMLHRDEDVQLELPASCEPGQQLKVNGYELTMIEVRRG